MKVMKRLLFPLVAFVVLLFATSPYAQRAEATCNGKVCVGNVCTEASGGPDTHCLYIIFGLCAWDVCGVE